MTVSTKGRYALRVMIDLAEHGGGKFIPLKEIAESQNISQKYLESITAALSKSGLIEGAHGKGGGYRLKREPENYTVREVLEVTEGDLSPIACLKRDADPCEMSERCRTLPMWKAFYENILAFFESYKISDLMKSPDEDPGSWII